MPNNKTHMGNKGQWDRPVAPASFPYAQSKTLAAAPNVCPRCGSPWKSVSEGLQCRVCPQRWHVAECLQELVGRTLQHQAWAHVPRTATPPRRAA